ncbi:DUF167 domain-containing protein [Leeia aquatica]|uniref:UPF0235 protein HF682_15080 n=1 Tax=Leeia aquatica TaxID=2725557 RepID=A0A847SH33_9NEIS|nr:DUF167 domain-containing protein [Leeia aquatica]NLR76489.1 YggU family protein [Leeia aquatica]
MNASWLRQAAPGEWILTLHIQPGAKRSEVVGVHGEALKIRLAAPPVDGKANAALLAFLATQLNIPQRQLELLSGETSRSKRVKVSGPDETLRPRLQALVAALG